MYVRSINTAPLPSQTPSTDAQPAAAGATGSAASAGFDPDAFNPHDPAFLADPYPTYALFREHAPVHPVKPYESCWVFRHSHCLQVLEDTATWVKNPPGAAPPGYGPPAMMPRFPQGLFTSDPPLHTQLRDLLEPVFMNAIETAPSYAREIGEPLLAAARAKGAIELVADYALPLPAGVLFAIFDIPEGEHEKDIWSGLIAWQAAIAAAHDITQPLTVRGAGATCSMALNTFFEGMLLEGDAASASRASKGLFAAMVKALRGAGLSAQQVQICACDLLVAGYLSTTFVIALGMRNLLLHPDQLQKLRAEPALVHSAYEEMLRFDAPVHIVDRCAAVATELAGRTFAPGDNVSVVLGSANRDPDAFSEPDRFEIERAERTHLGYGWGIHHCIGAPLSRMVAPLALAMLLAEFDTLALAGPLEWQTDPYLRSPRTLPLRF